MSTATIQELTITDSECKALIEFIENPPKGLEFLANLFTIEEYDCEFN